MNKQQGMVNFFIIWVGQVFSLVGTSMTGFALTIWAWTVTGQATALALVGFFSFAPTILMSPFAGALVDRWPRKLTMMISDLASGLMTAVVLTLYLTGHLQIWHLYITGAFSGIFQAFQWPAYSAAISVMVPKEQYGRAAGMISIAESGSGILAPVLAAALIGFTGIHGVLLLDLATLALAITALLVARVPNPPLSKVGLEAKGSLLKEAGFGFRYIASRPSLLGLQLVFFLGNLIASISGTVMAPRILAETGNNATILGTVESVGGIGGLVGGVIMSIWGGPKPRINGVLVGWALSFLFSNVLFGLASTPLAWSITAFLGLATIPIINGSNQAIWQAKVPPDIQGKVFSVRRLIAQISAPVAMLVAGPLADKIFEPQMKAGGPIAKIFGPILGIGPGKGMAAMMVCFGLLGILIAFFGYFNKSIRKVEDIIPDFTEELLPENSGQQLFSQVDRITDPLKKEEE